MSNIKKGRYELSFIESTGQFTIKGYGYTENGILYGSSSMIAKDAKDLIDLLQAYLIATKSNKGKES